MESVNNGFKTMLGGTRVAMTFEGNDNCSGLRRATSCGNVAVGAEPKSLEYYVDKLHNGPIRTEDVNEILAHVYKMGGDPESERFLIRNLLERVAHLETGPSTKQGVLRMENVADNEFVKMVQGYLTVWRIASDFAGYAKKNRKVYSCIADALRAYLKYVIQNSTLPEYRSELLWTEFENYCKGIKENITVIPCAVPCTIEATRETVNPLHKRWSYVLPQELQFGDEQPCNQLIASPTR